MFQVQDRLEIILDTWIELGCVPSPAEVSKQEGIDLPWSQGEALHLLSLVLGSRAFEISTSNFEVGLLSVAGKDSWPIRIGCLDNSKDHLSKLSMMAMQFLSSDDYYFLSMETVYTGVPRRMQVNISTCSI